MIEFGAKLSLKDNMSATLQKNLKLQKQFSEQVKQTNNSIKSLAKAKIAPVIKAKDQASSIVKKVKDNLKTVGKTVAKPFIVVKDSATKVLTKTKNTLKTIGKTVAKPFVALKDRASPILNKVKGGLKAVGSFVAKPLVALKDGATKGLSKIKSMLGTLAKGATIAMGVVGAGATALIGGSIAEGAKLQQSKGGVETLYKGKEGDGGAVDTVIANANKAYRTAGLSANAYMETVTSFSASLLQSVSGDTEKSAKIADMAIVDMADNANKFGTDMSSIQTAYQGFAKQNYTMLDNLKLGYGGTKEEMQRLLKDAQKISGVKYDIKNLSDVYSAIHVVQENLGVAGATADEAEKTFSGSFASMKASFSNLMGAMSTGGNVDGAMEELVNSASTFLFNNAIPMVGKVLASLPKAIFTGIKKASPRLKEAGGEIAKNLKDGLKAMLPSSMSGAVDNAFSGIKNIATSMAPVVEQLGGMFSRVSSVISNSLGGAFGESGGLIQSFADVISSTIPVVEPIITGFANVFGEILPLITPIIQTFSSVVQQVFPIVSSVISSVFSAIMPIIQAVVSAVQQALPIIQNVIQVVAGIVQSVLPVIQQIIQEVGVKIAEVITRVVTPVITTFQKLFEKMAPIIKTVIETVVTVLSGAWDFISPVLDLVMVTFELLWSVIDPILSKLVDGFEWLWGILEPIFSGISEGLSWLGDGIGKVADWLGGVLGGDSGKGHAYGLGRVPYNNYPARLHEGEKVLTRNQADQYDRAMSTRGVTVSGTVEPYSHSTSSTGGTTVSIEKLADTVVIEKEADVDKVVENMITKFRKLVPNMA